MTDIHPAVDRPYLQPLIVSIWHDPDTDSPNDHDGLFRLVAFSSRLLHSDDPDKYIDGTPRPDIAAYLSYFEHGHCRWSRSGHGPADYGGFDTVGLAGVLLLTDDYVPGGEWREWWHAKSEDERNEAIDSFLGEYTDWANGETYGYTVETQTGECPTCHRPNEPELVDSCGGFIGFEYIAEVIRETVADLWNVDIADLVAGRHFIIGGSEEMSAMTAEDVLSA